MAKLIWDRLGDVANFVEPFCGSAAVLLARPHPPRVETVNEVTGDFTNAWRATDPRRPGAVDQVVEVINDLDPYLANVWRSLQGDPDGTAEWADNPVSELDLHAIHRSLVLGEGAAEFRERIRSDPDYFDPVRAGRYLFGLSAWIGGGWCSVPGEGRTHGALCRPVIANPGTDAGRGVHGNPPPKRRPTIGGDNPGSVGKGVHAGGGLSQQVPPLEGAAPGGVHSGRPQLADAYSRGRGVHGNDDAGTCARRRAWLVEWFGRLRDRLRTVRVCCGHFLRVMESESVTTRLGVTGIFADPPYPSHNDAGEQSRDGGLYATDKGGASLIAVRDQLLAYCLERGAHPKMRICVAAYEGDGYEPLLERGWTVEKWTSQGGYSNRSKDNKNRGRERLFFSPHCRRERTLFDDLEEREEAAP